MRLSGVIPALLLAATASAAEPTPTAVFTLDARVVRLSGDPAISPAAHLEAHVSRCTIVPGEEPLFALDCPEQADEDIEARPAVIALFRDLKEVVYLAACPLIEEEREPARRPTPEKDDGPEELDPATIDRLCADVEQGRTFSAEVHGDQEIRIVNRGRQLRLALFRTQLPPQRISTAYTPEPSRGSLGHAGPDTTSGGEFQEPPPIKWQPRTSERATRAKTRLPKPSLRNPTPAETDLRTGSLSVDCPRNADLYLDGAHPGACPMRMPIEAGRYRLEVRRGARTLTAKEIELEGGEALTLELPE